MSRGGKECQGGWGSGEDRLRMMNIYDDPIQTIFRRLFRDSANNLVICGSRRELFS